MTPERQKILAQEILDLSNRLDTEAEEGADGSLSVQVSFDMRFGPDRVEWVLVKYLKLIEKAAEVE